MLFRHKPGDRLGYLIETAAEMMAANERWPSFDRWLSMAITICRAGPPVKAVRGSL